MNDNLVERVAQAIARDMKNINWGVQSLTRAAIAECFRLRDMKELSKAHVATLLLRRGSLEWTIGFRSGRVFYVKDAERDETGSNFLGWLPLPEVKETER